MTWPLSQDYNEAIQSPARNFTDPDLRCGQPVLNALALPMPHSGNFADVYEVRCPGGERWAVKCFTRESPNLRERYAEISNHLHQARLKFTVDFTWLEEGIRVAGQWYPVLKMQWVEGLLLNQFVAQSLDRPAMLDGLLRLWPHVGRRLHRVGAAHGDLQHGNVLLVREGSSLALKLIDYDGLFVPALANRPSGEVGHPAYQHPQRAVEKTYNPDMDNFSLLLITVALSALKQKGRELWEQYDNGDNLLFREEDLKAPTRSPLFRDLLRSEDPLTAVLAGRLFESLRNATLRGPEALVLDGLVQREPVSASDPPVRKGWYYRHGEAVHGPVSPDVLHRLADTGELLPIDLIWPSDVDSSEALPAEATIRFSTPGPVEPPGNSAPDWLPELARALAAVDDLTAQPTPTPEGWLADVRRVEGSSGFGEAE